MTTMTDENRCRGQGRSRAARRRCPCRCPRLPGQHGLGARARACREGAVADAVVLRQCAGRPRRRDRRGSDLGPGAPDEGQRALVDDRARPRPHGRRQPATCRRARGRRPRQRTRAPPHRRHPGLRRRPMAAGGRSVGADPARPAAGPGGAADRAPVRLLPRRRPQPASARRPRAARVVAAGALVQLRARHARLRARGVQPVPARARRRPGGARARCTRPVGRACGDACARDAGPVRPGRALSRVTQRRLVARQRLRVSPLVAPGALPPRALRHRGGARAARRAGDAGRRVRAAAHRHQRLALAAAADGRRRRRALRRRRRPVAGGAETGTTRSTICTPCCRWWAPAGSTTLAR